MTTVPAWLAQHRLGVVVRRARVDDDGKLRARRPARAGRGKQASLLGLAVGAVVVVEARLADGDRLRVREQLAQLVDAPGFVAPGLVRVDAERRVDAVVPLGQSQGRAARLDAGADRDDPRHAGRACARDRSRRVLERVEVRVRVDHAARGALHARELVGDDLLRIELREERSRLAQWSPRRQLARLQVPADAV